MEADRRGLPYIAEKKAATLEMDVEKRMELNKVRYEWEKYVLFVYTN